MSFIHFTKSCWNKLLITLVSTAYILLSAGLVRADDTEIYVTNASITPSQPNILFIMDTSGSMSLAPSSGGAPKIEQMKSALTSLLDGLHGVNVGLMRFSAFHDKDTYDAGGPILYPVKDIEATVDPLVIAKINRSSDDGVELPTGQIAYKNPTISLVKDFIDCPSCRSTTVIPLAGPDNIIKANATNQSVAVLGDNANELALRFQVNIPAGARVVASRLIFTAAPNDGSAKYSEPLDLNMYLQKGNVGGFISDPAPFVNGTSLNSARTYYFETHWLSIPTFVVGNEYDLDTFQVVDWSLRQPQWSPGDHIVLKFARRKIIVSQTCIANCTPIVMPPCVDDGEGPACPSPPSPVYSNVYGYPANPALRNAYGVGTANPPRLEIQWIPAATKQKVLLRFDEVHVPQGATVTSAFIDFATNTTVNNDPTSLDVYAEKSVNSATLDTTSFNITNRPLTAAHVDWDNLVPWGHQIVVDDRKTTPNLASIVQEVVNQPGWCSGKPMSFIILGDSTGERHFKSWDSDPTEDGKMPTLKIRYDDSSVGSGCNTNQVVAQVANESEDGEETPAATGSLTSSTALDSTNYIGLRFQNIVIPQGATITSAHLKLTPGSNTSAAGSRVIRALDADDAPPWAPVSGYLVSAPKTSASASWTPDNWTKFKTETSSDISNVVQAVISRPGWHAGNSLALILDPAAGTNYVAWSAGSPLRKPELVISYSAAFVTGSRTVRDELKYMVAGLTAQGSTPISGALAEAARYYRGEAVYYGKNRGFASGDPKRRFYRTSHPDSFTGGADSLPTGCYDRDSNVEECQNEVITGSPTYISPIENVCQTNNIVLLSDGTPNTSFPPVKTIVDPIIVGDSDLTDGFIGYPGGCAPALDGKDCSLKLVEALSHEDQETVLYTGIQRIKTHTIGFDLTSGGPAAQFLADLAAAGDSSTFSASSASGLSSVFGTIVNSLQRDSSSFVSAGVSVNQANRLVHRDELYFALFQPDADITWPGNLKRYKLLNGEVVDVNGVNAVLPTGRFDDAAQSFWSNVVDGDGVDLGGAASRLTSTRPVYSNIIAAPITNPGNRVIETNTNITDADLNAINAADRVDILRWARGIDDANGGIVRTEMGDPLHSRPVVANYPGNVSTVFMGTNHGYLHSISTTTGEENWSFIPKELLGNLTVFQKNSVVSGHLYGLDGTITLYHEDTDHDSIIDSGETAILFVGMRRGGRNYYALDVSNPTAPQLLYEIKGGVGDYAELGQTWSRIIVGKINFNGAPRQVAVFGGGYDSAQDVIGPHVADTVGRTVFIADALTGARLWSARVDSVDPTVGTSARSNLTNSIPADIKVIDLSGDGFIDHLYVSDTAGQVFRFDIDNAGNSGAADLAVGGRLANLQTGVATEFNNRRFYYAPDVAAIKRPHYEDFVAVSIGSGYRAHPAANGTNDKFYVIRDTWILHNNAFPAITSTPRDLNETDLLDVSTIIGDANGDGISDALALIEDTAAPKYGWFLDFLQTGEKVLAESVTFDNKVIVTTYKPNLAAVGTGLCKAPEGSSRAYIMNIVDGTPSIDNNTDGDLLDLTVGPPDTTTCGDRCMEVGHGIPPSGLVLFEPEGATICFGTQCFKDVLSTKGERLQRVKWRRRDGP